MKPRRTPVADRIRAAAAAHPTWNTGQIAAYCDAADSYTRRVLGIEPLPTVPLRDRLPRKTLVALIRSGLSDAMIGERYGTSGGNVTHLRRVYGLRGALEVVPAIARALVAKKRRATIKARQAPTSVEAPWPTVNGRLRAAWDRGEGPDFRRDNLRISTTARWDRRADMARADMHSVTGCSAAMTAALGGV